MGNFLRHSFAHFGSSQVEAIATILSFHLHSAMKLNKIKEHICFLCVFTLGPCAAHARYLWHRQAGESLFLSCRLRCHPGDHIHASSPRFFFGTILLQLPYFPWMDCLLPRVHTSQGPNSIHPGQIQMPLAGETWFSVAATVWNYILGTRGGVIIVLSQLCRIYPPFIFIFVRIFKKSAECFSYIQNLQQIYKYLWRNHLYWSCLNSRSLPAVATSSPPLQGLSLYWSVIPSWTTGCRHRRFSWTSCASWSSPPPGCSRVPKTLPKSQSGDTSRLLLQSSHWRS